jgi:hypothetical protein
MQPAFTEAPGTLIRTSAGHITFWSSELEKRYGFSAAEAVGQISHELLRASHWQAPSEIERTLVTHAEWQGGLIVHRADDQPMIVANHWLLQHGADGLEALVTEVHSDIVTPGTPGANELADVVATIAQELSQPLTAVGGFVAGAQRAANPPWPNRGGLDRGLSEATAQLDRASKVLARVRALAETLRNPRLRELRARLAEALSRSEDLARETLETRIAVRTNRERSVSARCRSREARAEREAMQRPDLLSVEQALALQSIQVFRRCLASAGLDRQAERVLRQLLAKEEARVAASAMRQARARGGMSRAEYEGRAAERRASAQLLRSQGMTVQAIADRLDVSDERVRQLLSEGAPSVADA